MSSRRVERVSQQLKQIIGNLIVSELRDPRMGFMTVTKVEPTQDLREAKIHVSILGEESERRRTMHGLKHATGFLQREAGKQLSLRTVPILTFVEDDSVKKSVRISRLIAESLEEETAEEQEDDPK